MTWNKTDGFSRSQPLECWRCSSCFRCREYEAAMGVGGGEGRGGEGRLVPICPAGAACVEDCGPFAVRQTDRQTASSLLTFIIVSDKTLLFRVVFVQPVELVPLTCTLPLRLLPRRNGLKYLIPCLSTGGWQTLEDRRIDKELAI